MRVMLMGPGPKQPPRSPSLPVLVLGPSGGRAAVPGPLARAAGRGAGVHLLVALALELLVEDAGCEGGKEVSTKYKTPKNGANG